ncbi:MAG: Bug family tripartite tricarboxylate transporter substrate binding protein [Burkholderiaceae bacterium]
MSRLYSFLALLCAGLMLATSAGAQQYPSRPIKLVVPFAAGGQTDRAARYVAEHVRQALGQTVIVENLPGANGLIAMREFIKRPADGYNVLLTSNTTHSANPHLYKSLPYDPVKDFTPVACLMDVPLILAIRASLPIRTVDELTTYAKENPGKLTFGWANSTSQAGVELLKSRKQIALTAVPYKGMPQVITDLLGSHIDLVLTDPSTAMGQLQSGALRPLAVTSKRRVPLFQNVPTMIEAGVPDYELIGWLAVFLPANVPQNVIAPLHAALVGAINSPAFRDFANETAAVPTTCSPAELASLVRTDSEKWRQLVEISKIEKQ